MVKLKKKAVVSYLVISMESSVAPRVCPHSGDNFVTIFIIAAPDSLQPMSYSCIAHYDVVYVTLTNKTTFSCSIFTSLLEMSVLLFYVRPGHSI